MNWTLVALLSIPGALMGLLSVKGHTRGIEPYLWGVLAVFATLVIARTAGTRYFLHGLFVGIAWGLLNGIIAAGLFSIYKEHNPEVMARLSSSARAPQLMFLIGALPIGAVTGLVLGRLCWGAHSFIPSAASLR